MKKKQEGSVLRSGVEVKMSVAPDGAFVWDVFFCLGT